MQHVLFNLFHLSLRFGFEFNETDDVLANQGAANGFYNAGDSYANIGDVDVQYRCMKVTGPRLYFSTTGFMPWIWHPIARRLGHRTGLSRRTL